MSKKLIKTFSGYCPTLEKNYTIEVEYIDVNTFQKQNVFIQGLAICEHHGLFSCPVVNDCPIRAKAPNELNL